jgi:predicted MFS family arabinose efflux permease
MRGAVAVQTPAFGVPSTACILAACTAEILGLTGYSIVPALLPQIMAAWSLDSTQGGWLAGINAGGYVVGVVPLVAATDRMPPRTVYLVCAALSVISSFGPRLAMPSDLPLSSARSPVLASLACICLACAR